MKLHPFAGKLRTLPEIAEICGMTSEVIERCISNGNSLPFTKARIRWLRDQEAPKTIYQSPAPNCGAPKCRLTVDGMIYYGIIDTAKSLKIPLKRLQNAIKRYGRELKAEHLGQKPRGGKGLKVTVDGRSYGGLSATAEALGVNDDTLRERIKKFGLALTSEQCKKLPRRIPKPKP